MLCVRDDVVCVESLRGGSHSSLPPPLTPTHPHPPPDMHTRRLLPRAWRAAAAAASCAAVGGRDRGRDAAAAAEGGSTDGRESGVRDAGRCVRAGPTPSSAAAASVTAPWPTHSSRYDTHFPVPLPFEPVAAGCCSAVPCPQPPFLLPHPPLFSPHPTPVAAGPAAVLSRRRRSSHVPYATRTFFPPSSPAATRLLRSRTLHAGGGCAGV